MPGTDTVTIYRGEDVTLTFTMNPVVDVTGYTLLFSVEGLNSVKLIEVAGTVTNGPSGEFQVALTDAETESIAHGHYTYDVWRTDSGSETVLAVGKFIVLDSARMPIAS